MIHEGCYFPDTLNVSYESGIYSCNQSYEQNYENGPQSPFALRDAKEDESGHLRFPASDVLGQKYSFLGLPLRNPLGVSAGPVLNARWVSYYFALGFGALVYKTVRSVFRASHPMPNCIPVSLGRAESDDNAEFDVARLELIQAQGKLPEVLGDFALVEKKFVLQDLSITNSFGVPSMAPEVWMPDFERSASLCVEGHLLIASVLGTEGAGGRDLVCDFGYVAAMARDAGAKIIEANLSCPNLVGGAGGHLYTEPEAAQRVAREIRRSVGKDVLVLLKIGYLNQQDLGKMVSETRDFVDGYAGINTISANVRNRCGEPALSGKGRLQSGVGGRALRGLAQRFVWNLSALREARKDDFAIVGVGGMMDVPDFNERLRAGADLAMSATSAMWDSYLPLRWLKYRSLSAENTI